MPEETTTPQVLGTEEGETLSGTAPVAGETPVGGKRRNAIKEALENPPQYPEVIPSYPNFNPEGKTPQELSEEKDSEGADFDPSAPQMSGEPQDKATIERLKAEREEKVEQAKSE